MRLQSPRNILRALVGGLALVLSVGCATTTTLEAARPPGAAAVRTPLPQTENPISDLPVVMGALSRTQTEISALQQRLRALRRRTHGLEDHRDDLAQEGGDQR